jgi:alkylated DNA repair dioxygenase AlkB
MDLFNIYKSDEEVISEIAENIPGLVYIPNFISETEEFKLINVLDELPWLNDLKRKVQHYGYKYDYKARRIDSSFKIGALPNWSKFLSDRLIEKGIIDFLPDQLIVNNYEPGEGIASHIDCEPCFTDTIISISLWSDIIMDFKNVSTNEKTSLLLQRRSVVVLKNDSRYKFEHGIAARLSDTFNGRKRIRNRRVSLTLRKVISVG